jgi:HEPN domain-containing protein
MADPRVVKEWLEKADEDLLFSESIIEDSTFYSQICFHFHQAAEKYLKAVIIALNAEFKRIHDLPVLLKACLPVRPTLQTLEEDCKLLNRFYVDTRYPVHWPTRYSKEEAIKARAAARHIHDAVKETIETLLERTDKSPER